MMDNLTSKTQFNLRGLTKFAIRRIASKAGVHRISRGVYDEVRYFIFIQVKDVTAQEIAELSNNDVEFAKAAFLRVVRIVNTKLQKNQIINLQRTIEKRILRAFENACSISEKLKRKTVTVDIMNEAMYDM